MIVIDHGSESTVSKAISTSSISSAEEIDESLLTAEASCKHEKRPTIWGPQLLFGPEVVNNRINYDYSAYNNILVNGKKNSSSQIR